MATPMFTLKRDVVTPATTVLFVVSTVTGLMLLLHWQSGLVKVSHEWLSLAFAAFAGWHLVKNRRAFVTYLHRHVAVAAIAVTLALSLVFTGLTGSTGATAGGPRPVLQALSGATLASAAPAFGLEPAAAAAVLRQAGYADAAPTDTLGAIAARRDDTSLAVMTVLAQRRS